MPADASTRRGGGDPAAVANRLHSAAIHLLRHVRRTDDVTGLTPARLSLLSVLVFGGPATISELAEAEQVSLPTLSRLVAALEDRGLVQRAGDPDDRRLVRAVATREGARVLLRARRARVERLAARLGELDRDALDTLGQASEILERLFE